MRRSQGLTVVEVMTVLSIVLLLTAILLPVLRTMRERSREEVCKYNMRQIHQALSLYRSAHDGDGVYDYPYAMGLPPALFHLGRAQSLPKDVLTCTGSAAPVGRPNSFVLVFLSREPKNEVWRTYVTQFQEESIFLIDGNHHNREAIGVSPYFSFTATAITLSGSLRSKRGRGNWTAPDWWH